MRLRSISVQIGAAIALSIALAFTLLLFFGVERTHAQLCGPQQPPVKVDHTVCIPPGPGVCIPGPPGSKGKDGCPCPVSGTQGGSVSGICQGGCCKLQSASGAGEGGGMPMLPMLPMPMPKPKMPMMPMPQQPGSFECQIDPKAPGCPCDIDPDGPGCPDSLLSGPTSIFDTITNALGLDSLFGGDNSDDDDSSGGGGDFDGGGASGSFDNAPAQEGDTVVTTYEYLEAVANGGLDATTDEATFTDSDGDGLDDDFDDDFDRDLAGDSSDFDSDFAGANLDDGSATSTLGLSQEALEIAGLETLARRGADAETHSGSLQLPYESLTPAEIRSLQDYHSSAVAVSGRLSPFQGNPLSNERFVSDEIEAQQVPQDSGPGFFSRVFSLLANIFGLGSPVR